MRGSNNVEQTGGKPHRCSVPNLEASVYCLHFYPLWSMQTGSSSEAISEVKNATKLIVLFHFVCYLISSDFNLEVSCWGMWMPASPGRPKLVHFDAIFNPLSSFPARQTSLEIHIILFCILTLNKLAKLQATLVRNRNYDSLTDWLTDGGEV